jgi:hypothetical protein
MLLTPAAAQAKRGSIYDITKASGFERLTFTGDPDSSCDEFSVCGYEGTTTYRISGTPKGTIIVRRTKSGKVSGKASYKTKGVTTTKVTPPAPAADCTDTVPHTRDVFGLSPSGPKFNSVLLTYHRGATDDYLKTQCMGPTEADVKAANAQPEGLFRSRDFFSGTRPKFNLGGGTPFRAKGFNVSVEWDLKYKAKARDCSPDCKLPAG